VGEKLREMMPWIKQRALVDRSRNWRGGRSSLVGSGAASQRAA